MCSFVVEIEKHTFVKLKLIWMLGCSHVHTVEDFELIKIYGISVNFKVKKHLHSIAASNFWGKAFDDNL